MSEDARKLDAEVAHRVLGWEVRGEWKPEIFGKDDRNFLVSPSGILEGWWLGDGSFITHAFTNLPTYTTDPRHDYEVLKTVRTAWDAMDVCAVRDALDLMWCKRADQERRDNNGERVVWGPNNYMPGDYSMAALAVVREKGGEDG